MDNPKRAPVRTTWVDVTIVLIVVGAVCTFLVMILLSTLSPGMAAELAGGLDGAHYVTLEELEREVLEEAEGAALLTAWVEQVGPHEGRVVAQHRVGILTAESSCPVAQTPQGWQALDCPAS